MRRWRNKVLLLAGVGALGLAIPAFSQGAPESILPPGFEEPPAPATNETAPAAPPESLPVPLPSGGGETLVTDASVADLEALEEQEVAPPIEIPDEARRSLDLVGPLGPNDRGLGADAFGSADGRYLSTLMRRLEAPLPSRWTSILLRRALLSHVQSPAGVNPADWVAERAWLLLRMGEADGARMLVQSVDVDRFTPKMFAVAVQTALATADPWGLCPLVGPGRETSDEPVWALSDAICAALGGEAGRASALIDQARRRGTARGVDLLLTEKIVGAGTDTRRAVTIDWADVDGLNTYRFGLAAAAGMDIPANLMAAAGPRMQAWQARAPMIPLDRRTAAAETAAAMGVFSNASLVEMYSLLADNTDVAEFQGSVGARLRTAYAARTLEARIGAIRALWGEADGPARRYARQILTAVAASQLPPSEALDGDAHLLLASMLSAGMDGPAARWASRAASLSGDGGERAWSLLAVGAPRQVFDLGASRIENHPQAALLFAGLAGLGRIAADDQGDMAQSLQVPIGRENGWTRQLDRAVQQRQPGTVALLAAIGMQTPRWEGVPPAHLYRIVRALRQVGLEYEARMIAAEALSRT